jgi:hypothetical protein
VHEERTVHASVSLMIRKICCLLVSRISSHAFQKQPFSKTLVQVILTIAVSQARDSTVFLKKKMLCCRVVDTIAISFIDRNSICYSNKLMLINTEDFERPLWQSIYERSFLWVFVDDLITPVSNINITKSSSILDMPIDAPDLPFKPIETTHKPHPFEDNPFSIDPDLIDWLDMEMFDCF